MLYLNKIKNWFIYTLIISIFFLPFLNNFNLGIIPLLPNYIPSIISISLLTSISTLVIIQTFAIKLIKLSYSIILVALIILFLGLQFALINPSYTAPYLNIISILGLLTIALLLIQNSSLTFKQILFYAAIGIMINSYIQIIFSTLQFTHLQPEYKFNFYGFNGPYTINWSPFELPITRRITGGIGQPNNLADILCWGLLANIYFFAQPGKFKNILFWLNLITISIYIVLTHSNTAYLYPFVLLIYSLYLLKFKTDHQNIAMVHKLIYSSVILCLILLAYHFIAKYNILHQLSNDHLSSVHSKVITSEPHNINSHDRLIMWGRAWMMFIQHPFVGVGWEQYLQYFLITPTPSFIPNTVGELTAFANCHNLILQLLATTGIFGTLLFIALILYLIINLAKQDLATQILPLGITLIVLTHSMFEYPLFNVAILIPVLLITATPDSKYFTINLKYKKSFLCLIGALITLAWWQIYVGINNFLLLSQAKKPANYQIHNLPHNILNVYFATASNPYWDDSADSVLAQNLLYSVRAPQNQKYFDLTYNVISRSAKYSPNPSFLLRLAVLDTVLGNTNKAQTEVNLVTQNYIGFNSRFESFFNAASHDNPSLNKKLLQLLPHK